MNEIILIGAGRHTRSCIDVILSTHKYKITGLIDKKSTIKNSHNLNIV